MAIVAISYPLTLPSTPAPVRTRFELRRMVGLAASPFSGHSQAVDWGGAVWMAEVSLPAMLRAAADEWIAFFHKMRGRYGYCRVGDWDRRAARGTWGTPLVKGGSQVGNTLEIDGVGNATTRYAGEMFQVGDYMHQLVADNTSDGSGNATLVFEPSLRASPSDNAAITFTNPKTLMRIASNSVPWDSDANAVHGFAFSLIEKL